MTALGLDRLGFVVFPSTRVATDIPLHSPHRLVSLFDYTLFRAAAVITFLQYHLPSISPIVIVVLCIFAISNERCRAACVSPTL